MNRPGAGDGGERFRLLYASKPALAAGIGAQVQGAGQSWLLPAVAQQCARRDFGASAKALSLLQRRAALRYRSAAGAAELRGNCWWYAEDSAGRVLALQPHPTCWRAGCAVCTPCRVAAPGRDCARRDCGRTVGTTATQVTACLYDNGRSRSARQLALVNAGGHRSLAGLVNGDLSGSYYTYLVDVYVPGVGMVRNRVNDPYAVSLNSDSRRAGGQPR